MTVNLPFFLLGLLLLWFPRRWMRLGAALRIGRRRRRPRSDNQREPGDPRVDFRREFLKMRNYFDLLRGTAGGFAVLGGAGISASLSADPELPRSGWKVLGAQLAILTLGVLIQTLRREHRRIAFFAPIFYLAGLSVALCGTWAALFAFILIWAVNPMLGNAQAFLATYGLLMLGFGLLLRGFGNKLPIAALLLCFLPVLLSLLTRRSLMIFSRKGFRPHTS